MNEFNVCSVNEVHSLEVVSSLCNVCAAPSKAPPPPPPREDKKDEASAAEEEDEDDEDEEMELKLLGHAVKIPRPPKLSQMPDWLRAVVRYRLPSSIDPFTGEQRDEMTPNMSKCRSLSFFLSLQT